MPLLDGAPPRFTDMTVSGVHGASPGRGCWSKSVKGVRFGPPMGVLGLDADWPAFTAAPSSTCASCPIGEASYGSYVRDIGCLKLK